MAELLGTYLSSRKDSAHRWMNKGIRASHLCRCPRPSCRCVARRSSQGEWPALKSIVRMKADADLFASELAIEHPNLADQTKRMLRRDPVSRST